MKNISKLILVISLFLTLISPVFCQEQINNQSSDTANTVKPLKDLKYYEIKLVRIKKALVFYANAETELEKQDPNSRHYKTKVLFDKTNAKIKSFKTISTK